ncbi:MAG: endonuclease/exonuclease/phosphatase family protein [Planctomycetaceae bacterium]
MQSNPDETGPPTLRVTNWNVEWATSISDRGRAIAGKIAASQPHVACLTESHADFFSSGHVVTAAADYGYGDKGARRKVVLWSQTPWTSVEIVGEPTLPSGRFVAAATLTPLGEIRFIGVCIPWKDAHVRTGRRDRSAWKDHSHFLKGLQSVLSNTPMERLILLGDFNQTIPRHRAPLYAFELLSEVLTPFVCPSAGPIPNAPKPTIDHICHTPDLAASSISVLSNQHDEIGELSDHFGLNLHLRLATSP